MTFEEITIRRAANDGFAIIINKGGAALELVAALSLKQDLIAWIERAYGDPEQPIPEEPEELSPNGKTMGPWINHLGQKRTVDEDVFCEIMLRDNVVATGPAKLFNWKRDVVQYRLEQQ